MKMEKKPKPTPEEIAHAQQMYKTPNVLTKYGYLKSESILEATLKGRSPRYIQYLNQVNTALGPKRAEFFSSERQSDLIRLARYHEQAIQQAYDFCRAHPDISLRLVLDSWDQDKAQKAYDKYKSEIHAALVVYSDSLLKLFKILEQNTPPTQRDMVSFHTFSRWLQKALGALSSQRIVS